MNGVHDMGGMHGFGPVHRDEHEPLFHAPWEGRVRAMMNALVAQGVFNLDEQRRTVESLPPAQYLVLTYFERWLAAFRMILEEKGVASSAAIEAALQQALREPGTQSRREDPALAAAILHKIKHPKRSSQLGPAPRFRPGDRVVARNQHVRGHTRLPRYVRGKHGVVDRVHGIYDLPDTKAHGRGNHPQPVYSVCFAACELWGDAASPRDSLYIDLWESYLDPA
jgi:nitrile hydratase